MLSSGPYGVGVVGTQHAPPSWLWKACAALAVLDLVGGCIALVIGRWAQGGVNVGVFIVLAAASLWLREVARHSAPAEPRDDHSSANDRQTAGPRRKRLGTVLIVFAFCLFGAGGVVLAMNIVNVLSGPAGWIPAVVMIIAGYAIGTGGVYLRTRSPWNRGG